MDSQQQLRDLVWVANSPSLLADAATTPRLDESKVDLDHLSAFLAEDSSHRVGRYFERLVLFWLQHVRGLEIVAHSLQINDATRTLGEIDFVFYDEQRRLTHWETAVKFYLYFPVETSVHSFFVGPNAADTLERKVDRLRSHQLPLSQTAFPDVEERVAFLKGRLFFHAELEPLEQVPDFLSKDFLRGRWLRCNELESLSRSNEDRFRILRKPNWLSKPPTSSPECDGLPMETLIERLEDHFAIRESPLLLSHLVANGTTFVELEQVFVVSEHWPETVPPSKGQDASN